MNLILAIIFLFSSSLCWGDTPRSITIGSSPAPMYVQDEAPVSFLESQSQAVPTASVPPKTTLTIIKEVDEDAPLFPFTRLATWLKVTYEGKTGWVSADNSVESEERRNRIQAQKRKKELADSINAETTEDQIREWYGEPEQIQDNGNVQTFKYHLDSSLSGMSCTYNYDLFVKINKQTRKVSQHNLIKTGGACP